MRNHLALLVSLLLISSCDHNNSKQVAMKFDTTESFFTGYGEALLTYSPEKISSFYQVPLTVYSDEGIQQVSKMKEVEAFWKRGVKPYADQGIKKSTSEIIKEDKLSEKITTCKVLWKNYDAAGKEVARETNFYILSKTDDGLKISGLIIMSQK